MNFDGKLIKGPILLKDLVKKSGNCLIVVRTNYPSYLKHEIEPNRYNEGMLYGCCEWYDNKLIPGDGDNYYLDWIVSKYEAAPSGHLTIWIDSDWVG